jgi:endonuclease-8
MEGPSLFLAQEQLQPFCGQKIIAVTGNTKIGKERFLNQEVQNIFAWGKHLVFQFSTFGFRVHFLLFGTYEATVEGQSITGDYKRSREPRLALEFQNGNIKMYNCSIKVIESSEIHQDYDFTIDIMSKEWSSAAALQRILHYPDEQIADVLLDQTIFSGVGNIIKNEVLWLEKVHPQTLVKQLSEQKIAEVIQVTHTFSHQFYEWRKIFQLRAHLQVYRKKDCLRCNTKIVRQKTGKRERWSYYCPVCQEKM